MSFTLSPLTEADIPACVSLYFAAFQNPHSLACWPRTSAAVRAWWTQMFLSELHEPGAHWLKVLPHDDSTAIAGYVKWVEPKPGVDPDIDLPEWPADADQALCDETFGAWARGRRKLMGTRGHWYLEMLATHPSYQNRGAGSLMLQYGTSRADVDGVEAYLEASPEAVPLYEKYGFREADRLDTFIDNDRVKGTWYRNMFMIRPPMKRDEVSN